MFYAAFAADPPGVRAKGVQAFEVWERIEVFSSEKNEVGAEIACAPKPAAGKGRQKSPAHLSQGRGVESVTLYPDRGDAPRGEPRSAGLEKFLGKKPGWSANPCIRWFSDDDVVEIRRDVPYAEIEPTPACIAHTCSEVAG